LSQDERLSAIRALDDVGRGVSSDYAEAVPGGSFLNDVLPVHVALRDLLHVPAEARACICV
jgi:hypothetical protein